jgi:hypothetical protein
MSYYDKLTESDLDRRGYPLGYRLWERIRRERLQPGLSTCLTLLYLAMGV